MLLKKKPNRPLFGGQMSANQFYRSLDSLGLSHEQASAWLGVSRRMAFMYSKGDVKVPGPVAKLIRIMLHDDLKPENYV